MIRRRYRKNGRRCQDCGRPWKPTTLIRFWATGMPYWVCGECIRPYRGMILKPCRHPECGRTSDPSQHDAPRRSFLPHRFDLCEPNCKVHLAPHPLPPTHE